MLSLDRDVALGRDVVILDRDVVILSEAKDPLLPFFLTFPRNLLFTSTTFIH